MVKKLTQKKVKKVRSKKSKTSKIMRGGLSQEEINKRKINDSSYVEKVLFLINYCEQNGANTTDIRNRFLGLQTEIDLCKDNSNCNYYFRLNNYAQIELNNFLKNYYMLLVDKLFSCKKHNKNVNSTNTHSNLILLNQLIEECKKNNSNSNDGYLEIEPT